MGEVSPLFLVDISEEEKNNIYSEYCPLLEGMTDAEKEDKIVEWASEGVISADVALVIAIKEGLIT